MKTTVVLLTPSGIVASRPDGSALIALREPTGCPVCNRVAAFVVNRKGRTICSVCDEKEGSA